MPRRSSRTARPAAVTIRRPHPLAWQQALALAGGDPSRLTVTEDGTVLVANTARR